VTDTSLPLIESGPQNQLASFSQSATARALRHTAFAVGEDEKQPQLRGALLETKDGIAHFVTTDGHRLARYSLPTTAKDAKVLLPESLLAGMSRAVSAVSEGTVSICATDAVTFARFDGGQETVELSHRVVSGQFPNYRAVIPCKAEASVRLNALALETAVKRCLTIADTKSQLVRLRVSAEELRVCAAEEATGETTDILRVSSDFQFHAFDALFRGAYLLDVLGRIRGDVRLGFAKIAGAPGLWIVHSPEAGETFEYVLLGIKQ
jgi:DNA polymerase-3 subunit beta